MEFLRTVLNNITIETFLIVSLITYICIFSIYTPRRMIRFISNKFVIVALIVVILTVFFYNKSVAILMVLALLVTITLNNNLVSVENKLRAQNKHQITEKFSVEANTTDGGDDFNFEDDAESVADSENFEVNEQSDSENTIIMEKFMDIENAVARLKKSILSKSVNSKN